MRVNDRGPYRRDRVIDLSIGTAKALEFHKHGLARVRVEYVGRAPIEGSDDRMLLATLRDGGPAPAPSKVMLASAKPFLAGLRDDAPSRFRRRTFPKLIPYHRSCFATNCACRSYRSSTSCGTSRAYRS